MGAAFDAKMNPKNVLPGSFCGAVIKISSLHEEIEKEITRISFYVILFTVVFARQHELT